MNFRTQFDRVLGLFDTPSFFSLGWRFMVQSSGLAG